MNRPLVWAAAAFAIGVAGLPSPALWVALVLGLCIAAARAVQKRAGWLEILSILLWLAAGHLRQIASFERLPADHFSFLAPDDACPVACEAVLEEEPRPMRPPESQDRRAAARARLRSIALGGKTYPVSGAVRLVFPEGIQAGPGRRVRGEGRLFYVGGPTNPGERGFRETARREGRLASVWLDSAAPDGGTQETGFAAWAWRIRRRLNGVLEAGLDPPTADFLGALLLGVRSELSADLKLSFQESGTLHFLAISGLHLLFLLWVVDLLLRIALGVRLRAGLLAAAALGYSWMVGFNPPVTRACVLALVYLGSDLVGRPRDFLNTMALGFLGILLLEPWQLFLPGFQLSFLACLGIAYLPAAVKGLWRKMVPVRRQTPALAGPRGLMARLVAAALGWVGDVLLFSVCAWIATFPIVLYHFHLVSPCAVVGNLLLAPFVSAALLGGFLYLFLPWVFGWGAAPLGVCCRAIEFLAAALAALPGGHAYLPAPSLTWVFCFGGCVALWGMCVVPAGRACLGRMARPAVYAVLAAALPGGWWLDRWCSRPQAGFAVLDVRQGLCSFLVTEDGVTLVYDCGSYGGRDPSPSAVAPALWSRDVRRIDALALSHPHADHFSGVESLARRFPIGVVYVGPRFGDFPEGAALLADLRGKGIDVRHVGGGDRLDLASPGWEFQVLHPPRTKGPPAGANDESLVLRAERKGPRGTGTPAAAHGFRDPTRTISLQDPLSILWTGDLQEAGIRALLASQGALIAARVVVTPHHGSMVGEPSLFADAVRAAIVVNSAKRGFASPGVLEVYRKAGARVLETHRDGAVVIEWKE